jgi:hypothetical protein
VAIPETPVTNQKLVLALVIVGIAGSACRGPGEDADAFQWTNALPAGAVVHLRDGAGDITVRPAVGQAAVITGSRQWKRSRASDIKFEVTQDGNDYYVCAMWRGSGKCGESGYKGRSTGGLLSMFSLFHRANDASAHFVADIPTNVTVDAKTSNGSVTVDGMSAGVSARAVNGSVVASNVSGQLNLSTTNGNVRLVSGALAPADSIRLTTTNGSIRAELPADADGAFDLMVVNGLMKSDFPVPSTSGITNGKHLRGQIGTSGRIVKMRTVNGTVSVTRRAAPTTH